MSRTRTLYNLLRFGVQNSPQRRELSLGLPHPPALFREARLGLPHRPLEALAQVILSATALALLADPRAPVAFGGWPVMKVAVAARHVGVARAVRVTATKVGEVHTGTAREPREATGLIDVAPAVGAAKIARRLAAREGGGRRFTGRREQPPFGFWRAAIAIVVVRSPSSLCALDAPRLAGLWRGPPSPVGLRDPASHRGQEREGSAPARGLHHK